MTGNPGTTPFQRIGAAPASREGLRELVFDASTLVKTDFSPALEQARETRALAEAVRLGNLH